MLQGKALATMAGPAEPAPWSPVPREGDLDLRQLRHHTKNALQRIAALVATAPGLRATEAGRRVAAEAERRVLLAAQVSDALFGLTRAPGALAGRLRLLSESLAELLADPDQVVHVEVEGDAGDQVPAALHGAVLSAAQELVGNAVKHGFYARLVGRVRVELAADACGIRLVVADDGWGLCRRPDDGQGLDLVRALIAPLGGTLSLRSGRTGGLTAEVALPTPTTAARHGTARSGSPGGYEA